MKACGICSCVFDLRFSFLESWPRYWQQDVTSARARSNAVVKRTLAHKSVCTSQNPLLQHLIMSKTDRKRDENPSPWTHFNKLFWVQTSLTDPKFSRGIKFPSVVILFFACFPITICNLQAKGQSPHEKD